MTTGELDRRLLLGAAGVVGVAALTRLSHAGPLNPPAGAVTGTPGPEPRTVINAANTPGDANSVFKITQPGNYVLSQDVPGESGKHGVLIALLVPGVVTIDMRGFTMRGGAGSLNGIEFGAGTPNSLTISNGTIVNWGGNGINGAPSSATILSIIGVLIGFCAVDGMRIAPPAPTTFLSVELKDILISSCRDGISFGGSRNGSRDTVIMNRCRSTGNSRHGIHYDATAVNSRVLWDPSVVCASNGGDGIRLGATLTNCTATFSEVAFACTDNGGRGIGSDLVLNGLSKVLVDLRHGVIAGNFIGTQFAGSCTNSSLSVTVNQVTSDWNGDAMDTIGVMSNGRFSMRIADSTCRGNSGNGLRMAPTGNGFFDVFCCDMELCQNTQWGAWATFPSGITGTVSCNGCGVTSNGAGGISIAGGADVLVRSCNITSNNGNGVMAGPGAKECTLADCQLSSNSGYGFRFESPGSGAASTGCFRIDNCVFRRSGMAGASIDTCRGGEIVRSTFTSGGAGVALGVGAVGVTIDSCTAANNTGTGLSIASTGNVVIRNTLHVNGAGGNDHIQMGASNVVGSVVNEGNVGNSTNPHGNYVH